MAIVALSVRLGTSPLRRKPARLRSNTAGQQSISTTTKKLPRREERQPDLTEEDASGGARLRHLSSSHKAERHPCQLYSLVPPSSPISPRPSGAQFYRPAGTPAA
jgi:hypothetical protein